MIMIDENFDNVILTTDRLVLKALDSAFAHKIISYKKRNLDFFRTGSPGIEYEELSKDSQIEMLRKEIDLQNEKRALHFYIFGRHDLKYEEILGDVFVYNILHFPASNCSLGYRLDKEHTGNGLMSEALKFVIKYLFYDLNMHRIEINILPENQSSVKLARKLNFKEEGVVKDFLYINGKWRDHLRLSLIKPDKYE